MALSKWRQLGSLKEEETETWFFMAEDRSTRDMAIAKIYMNVRSSQFELAEHYDDMDYL